MVVSISDDMILDFSSIKLPTDEQKEIIYNKDRHLLVAADAGTGKTKVIVEFARQKLDEEGEIVLISHSKTAVKTLKGRTEGIGLNIRTVHSLGYQNPEAKKRFIMTKDFNDLLVPGTKRFKWAVIDEMQDFKRKQYDMITSMADNIMGVGDPWQAIYTFGKDGSKPELMEEFSRTLCGGKKYSLNTNFRSCGSIIRIANKFSGKTMRGSREEDGLVSYKTPSSYENLTLLVRTNKDVRDWSAQLVRMGLDHTKIEMDPNTQGRTARNWVNGRYEIIKDPKEYLSTLVCTIFNAKGDEWNRVWLVYGRENLPEVVDEIQEERVFYVGLTRARNELYIAPRYPIYIRRLE